MKVISSVGEGQAPNGAQRELLLYMTYGVLVLI